MTFCTNCGAKVDDGIKFCGSCGKPVQPAGAQPAADSSQPEAPPQAVPRTVNVGQVKKCPSCGQALESFQTRCPSCGHEISTAKDEEAVTNFFVKLEELTNKEYEANKQREGKAKPKKKQPKAVILCEAIAVMSLILILLHVTGINRNILDAFGVSYTYKTSLSGQSYVTQSSDVKTMLIFDGNKNRIDMSEGLTSAISGTYKVSGNLVTIKYADVTLSMTIVNETTLRDGEGDDWALFTTEGGK
jgi:predicted RNA-binding Zn-ribbon protein involved in translation (DUF1610 family)